MREIIGFVGFLIASLTTISVELVKQAVLPLEQRSCKKLVDILEEVQEKGQAMAVEIDKEFGDDFSPRQFFPDADEFDRLK